MSLTKVRHSSLNRACYELKDQLVKHNIKINFETRLVITPLRQFYFEHACIPKRKVIQVLRKEIRDLEALIPKPEPVDPHKDQTKLF